MIDLIIDALEVYGIYNLGKHLWNTHKDTIVRTAMNYITDTIKETIKDPDTPISINVTLGGKK